MLSKYLASKTVALIAAHRPKWGWCNLIAALTFLPVFYLLYRLSPDELQRHGTLTYFGLHDALTGRVTAEVLYLWFTIWDVVYSFVTRKAEQPERDRLAADHENALLRAQHERLQALVMEMDKGR